MVNADEFDPMRGIIDRLMAGEMTKADQMEMVKSLEVIGTVLAQFAMDSYFARRLIAEAIPEVEPPRLSDEAEAVLALLLAATCGEGDRKCAPMQ